MSADNWTNCPRCTNRIALARETKLNEINALYGKIPADEFVRLLTEAEKMPAEQGEEDATLREDYELFISKTDRLHSRKKEKPVKLIFYVSYSAYCTECEWSFKFKHEEEIKL